MAGSLQDRISAQEYLCVVRVFNLPTNEVTVPCKSFILMFISSGIALRGRSSFLSNGSTFTSHQLFFCIPEYFLDWEKCIFSDLLDCNMWQRKQSPVYSSHQKLWVFSIFFPTLSPFPLFFSVGAGRGESYRVILSFWFKDHHCEALCCAGSRHSLPFISSALSRPLLFTRKLK